MKKNVLFLFVVLILVVVTACENGSGETESAKIANINDSLSYALGVKIGDDFKNQGVEVNTAVFAKGIADGIKGDFIFTDTTIGILLSNFQYEMDAKFEEEAALMLQKNIEEGTKFLNENRSRDGVIALPAGLQYKVIKEGSGPTPSANDSVMIHYKALFVDGTTFDQSYDRGLTGIRLSNVILGLSEGLLLMNEGSVYELYIPPDLGYGNEDFANVIPAGSTLIYRIELVEIVK